MNVLFNHLICDTYGDPSKWLQGHISLYRRLGSFEKFIPYYSVVLKYGKRWQETFAGKKAYED